MLPGLGADPANQARVRLGLGLCKAESDPTAAALALIELDVLPYGSVAQQCEARLVSAKLLIALADAQAKDATALKDERKTGWINDNRGTARWLLAAAAGASTDHPARAEAARLLPGVPADIVIAKPGDEAGPADRPSAGDKPAAGGRPAASVEAPAAPK